MSVQWGAEGRPYTAPRGESWDEVHHSMAFVVYWVLLPASVVVLALLAAGAWWLVGRGL